MINNQFTRRWPAEVETQTGNPLEMGCRGPGHLRRGTRPTSDEARQITGVVQPVDAGCVNKR